MFTRVPWAKVWDETIVVGVLAASNRGFFQIPTLNIASTFRVVVPAFTSGAVTVLLRFGFLTADAAVAPNGCDFALLAVAPSSSLRSVVFDPAAVLPGCVGTPPAILPPIVAVNITTPIGTNLRYQVFATCLCPD